MAKKSSNKSSKKSDDSYDSDSSEDFYKKVQTYKPAVVPIKR